MSNLIAKIKSEKKMKRVAKKDLMPLPYGMKKAPRNSKPISVVPNIADKTLPGSLYVDMKAHEFKLGIADVPIKDRPVEFYLDPHETDFSGVLAFLESLNSEQIDRVILDNKTDFKIRTLEEFTADIKREIAMREDVAVVVEEDVA